MPAGRAHTQEGIPARRQASGTETHLGKASLAPTSWRGCGFRVRPATAKVSFLDSFNLPPKNSNLPASQKSRENRMGRRNQSSRWQILLVRSQEERKSQQRGRTRHTGPRSGREARLSFQARSTSCPARAIRLPCKGL